VDNEGLRLGLFLGGLVMAAVPVTLGEILRDKCLPPGKRGRDELYRRRPMARAQGPSTAGDPPIGGVFTYRAYRC